MFLNVSNKVWEWARDFMWVRFRRISRAAEITTDSQPVLIPSSKF